MKLQVFIQRMFCSHLISIISDKCGRRFECARRLPFWRYLRDYFPARLIREAPLDRKKNYVFGYHPHGIIATGLWINFCTESNGFSELFPGIRLHPLTLVANLRVPFWREVLLSHGLCSVSRKTINYILNKGMLLLFQYHNLSFNF